MPKKILFFGDFGIDDAVSLIYAHLSKKIDIVGIVADYGNVPRNITVRNVHFLLDILKINNVPVFTGAERPMTGETPKFFTKVHGPDGLGPIVPKISPIPKIENFCEVTKLIKKYKDELIIVATGRLTSLATLFLLYPHLMESIKAYYIMGGAFLVPGNVTSVAEANFYADPVAANIVMNYAKNASIYPLNVTMNAIVTPQKVNLIHKKNKIKIIKPMLDFYYDFYKNEYPYISGSPLHDALTFSAIINKDIFKYVCKPVQIVTNDGISRGQSIADFRPIKQDSNKKISHKIAISFNYKYFIDDFMAVMTS